MAPGHSLLPQRLAGGIITNHTFISQTKVMLTMGPNGSTMTVFCLSVVGKGTPFYRSPINRLLNPGYGQQGRRPVGQTVVLHVGLLLIL